MKYIFFIYVISIGTYSCNTKNTEKIINAWPNGNKKVTYTIINNDSTNYIYKFYYPNGNIFKTGEMKDGLAVGDWYYYYQSGNLKSTGSFLMGVKEGDYLSYYETGEIEQEGIYTQGKISSLQLYNKLGNPIIIPIDLSKVIVDKPKPWSEDEINYIKTNMIVYYESDVGFYNNDYCDCILSYIKSNCDFETYKSLTDYQQSCVVDSVTQMYSKCIHLIN